MSVYQIKIGLDSENYPKIKMLIILKLLLKIVTKCKLPRNKFKVLNRLIKFKWLWFK